MSFGSNPLSAATIAKAKAGGKGKITATGDQEIIDMITSLEPKFGKKAMRKTLRNATKEIILPESKRLVPEDTGALKKSLTVRAMKRSRSRFGYEVVTRPSSPAAKYAASVEFGTKHKEATSFLRRAAYGNERRVFDHAVDTVAEVISELKAKAAK